MNYPTDPALFVNRVLETELIRKILALGPCQPGLHEDYSFPKNDSDGRVFRKQWYHASMRNGMTRYRDWLVYSPTKNSMFCFSCWLFGDPKHNKHSDPAFSDPSHGVSKWRKGVELIERHEKSQGHADAVKTMLQCRYRLRVGASVCQEQMRAYQAQTQHNREVVRRLLDITLFLAKQNIPFRAHRETKFACLGKVQGVNDGNFLELVKLLAKYDSVIAKHLNESKGNQTYLSSSIQNDFIKSIGDEVLRTIIDEIHHARYYGIVMDSTIDVSHQDQLSLSIRYVDKDFKIQERFIQFTDLESSGSENLFTVLETLLQELNLNINFVRSQAFDGASNMSGRLTGLQARVKAQNELAYYVHCCAHKLNLVLADACSSVTEVTIFFGNIEKIYTFITSSQPRLVMFEKVQAELGLTKVLQRICETRWYCKHSAVQSIKHNFPALLIVLERIQTTDQKPTTVAEARGLLSYISTFEFILLLEIWEDVLGNTFCLSNYLQSQTMDVLTASNMVKSTKTSLRNQRSDDSFEQKVKLAEGIANGEELETTFQAPRVRRRKRMAGENSRDERVVDPKSRFRTEVYYPIYDNLLTQLDVRFHDFLEYVLNFSCLLPRYIGDVEKFKNLVQLYSVDVDVDTAIAEYVQYTSFVKETPAIGEELRDAILPDILTFFKSNHLDIAYPNLAIMYRILGTISVSTAGAERTFSKLKLIKTYLRSTMTENRLSSLSLISIERELSETVNFENVVAKFSQMKKRKLPL